MSDEIDAQFRAIAKAVMRATADPGVFCRRADNFGEAIGSWEARAVNIALGPFVQQSTAERDQLRTSAEAAERERDRLSNIVTQAQEAADSHDLVGAIRHNWKAFQDQAQLLERYRDGLASMTKSRDAAESALAQEQGKVAELQKRMGYARNEMTELSAIYQKACEAAGMKPDDDYFSLPQLVATLRTRNTELETACAFAASAIDADGQDRGYLSVPVREAMLALEKALRNPTPAPPELVTSPEEAHDRTER